MKISITLAVILLIFAFLILPTIMLVVFFKLPNLNNVQEKNLQTQNNGLMQGNIFKHDFDEGKKIKTINKGSKGQKFIKIFAYVLFVLYLIFLFTLVFGKVYIKNGYIYVNIIKNASWFSLSFATAHTNIINLLYNLAMMFPVSAFVFAIQNAQNCKSTAKYYIKVFLKTILISFLISLFIETFQFILPVKRTTELFDLLTNTISGVLGFCYFFFLVLVCNKLRHRQPRQDKE